MCVIRCFGRRRRYELSKESVYRLLFRVVHNPSNALRFVARSPCGYLSGSTRQAGGLVVLCDKRYTTYQADPPMYGQYLCCVHSHACFQVFEIFSFNFFCSYFASSAFSCHDMLCEERRIGVENNTGNW